MKTIYHIGSFDLKTVAFLLACLIFTASCEQKTEEPPAHKYYKAKPMDKVPEKKVEEKRIFPSDSANSIPSDSLRNNLKDTTETLHDSEKKPEIKISKKYFYLHLHKKPLIS